MKDVITMLLAVVIALAIGFGVYWYMNQDDIVISADISVSVQEKEIPAGHLKYDGNGFSFLYPDMYVAISNGLIMEDEYEHFINPRPHCPTLLPG